MLTTPQEDILKEIYNVFVGEAANLLSEILQKRIYLSVPQVKLLSVNDIESMQVSRAMPELDGTILSTSLKFGSDFSGRAEFIFPTKQIKFVTALCMGEEYVLEEDDLSFSDEDFDVVKELGNIILNSIMGGMGSFLEMKLEYDVPQVVLHEKGEFNQTFFSASENNILLLYVNFSLEESEVIGFILIKFSLESIEFLMHKVNEISRELDE